MKAIGIFLLSIICLFSSAQESIFLSNPKKFTEVLGRDAYSIAALSSDKFVLAYVDGKDWQGKAVIGFIQNDTSITFGNPYTFKNDMSLNGVKVTRLSNYKFLLTFNTNDSTEIQVFDVSGIDIVSVGHSYTLKKDSYRNYSQIALCENKFVIAYYDRTDDYGKCALGEISATLDISIDSVYTFSSYSISNISYISLDTLSDSKFVIAYGYGDAIIGSIENDNVFTFSESYRFTLEDPYYINVVSLNENRFAIAYADEYQVMRGTVILGKVMENDSINYSDKYYYTDYRVEGINVSRLSENKFIIAYNNIGDYTYTGSLVKGIIDGNNLSFDQKVMYNNKTVANGINPLTSLNNERFLVIYSDGNYVNGVIRLCSTVPFNIINSVEKNTLFNCMVYPNPVKNDLFIYSDKETDNIVKLYNLDGRILLDTKFNSNNMNINLSGYQKGTYVIQVLNGNKQLTRRITIE